VLAGALLAKKEPYSTVRFSPRRASPKQRRAHPLAARARTTYPAPCPVVLCQWVPPAQHTFCVPPPFLRIHNPKVRCDLASAYLLQKSVLRTHLQRTLEPLTLRLVCYFYVRGHPARSTLAAFRHPSCEERTLRHGAFWPPHRCSKTLYCAPTCRALANHLPCNYCVAAMLFLARKCCLATYASWSRNCCAETIPHD